MKLVFPLIAKYILNLYILHLNIFVWKEDQLKKPLTPHLLLQVKMQHCFYR